MSRHDVISSVGTTRFWAASRDLARNDGGPDPESESGFESESESEAEAKFYRLRPKSSVRPEKLHSV